MKHTLFILALITATIQTFAQSPRIKLNQITKDSITGSVLISSPTDSGMVYSRDLFISYGADTFLILGGDTIVLQSDLIAEIGDSLLNYVNISGTQTITGAKTFSTDVEIDGKLDLNDGTGSAYVGTNAGASSTVAESNGIGYEALQNNSGFRSNGIGYQALKSNEGIQSNGFGYRALQNNTGNYSNGFGYLSLENNSGVQSNGFGYLTLRNNKGQNNTAIGNNAGFENDTLTGGNNTFLGYNASYGANTTITNATAVGANVTLSNSNTVILGNGADVGIGTTSPSAKLDVVGDVEIDGKLDLDATGNSVFIGEDAGLNDDGSDNFNVGVGYQALYSNTTGFRNTAIGYQALFYDTTGFNNTAIGYQALRFNETGYENAGHGYQALYSNTTGIRNTANGRQALFANESGNNNVANGNQAGRYYGTGTSENTDSDNSVFIGYDSRPLADAQENQIVIGYEAIGLGSNSVVLGNSSITKTRLQGDVGIGTDSPSADLDVVGDVEVNGNLTVTGTINNEPTYKQISLGEGYADNIREFYYDNSITVHPSNLGYSYAELIKEDLLNEASLILTPTATSVGKLYTQKPLGSSDAFDFVRDSVATRVNSLGLIETVADSVPRIDYTDGEPSLLLEPSRTNLLPYSEDFDNASWSKTNIFVDSNAVNSPDGSTNADKLTENTSSGEHRIQDDLYLTSGIQYTFSVYAKANGRDYIRLRLENGAVGSGQINTWFNIAEGTVGTSSAGTNSIVDMGNGWYRCISTGTANTNYYLTKINVCDSDANVSYTGDSTSGVYLYGAQIEQGSYPTSYIPTNGSTVTRAADVATNAGDTTIFNDSEGVLYAELSALVSAEGDRTIAISDGTTSNRVYLSYIAASNTVNAIVVDGGSSQASISVSDIQSINSKLAIKYKANDVAFWVDGVEVGTDTSATMPSGLSELAFDDGGGSNPFYGNVKSVKYFPTALTDSELEALTQP